MQLPIKEKRHTSAYMGLLLAFALILSYLETLLPLQPGIPGVKLGLANLAVLLALELLGPKEAALLTVVKALLAGFLFGSLLTIAYSLAGAVLSVLVMILLSKSGWFHAPAVSAAGGVCHNLGQLLVAAFAVDTYGVFYYMPVLTLVGMLTGLVNGFVALLVLPYIRKIMVKGIS